MHSMENFLKSWIVSVCVFCHWRYLRGWIITWQWVCVCLVLGDELLNLGLVFLNPVTIGGQRRLLLFSGP